MRQNSHQDNITLPIYKLFQDKRYNTIPKKPFYPPSNSGFTLIELLIVVGIIGILGGIAGANYVDALHRADKALCQKNLRTVYHALLSYKVDYGSFPPADGVADTRSRTDSTAWACGPAANGYWSGVSLLLSELDYCAEDALYCPALKRSHNHHIDAYDSCSNSAIADKTVPQWQYLRFAYNNAAIDVGGSKGGEFDIEHLSDKDVWLVRCLHVDVGQFDPERAIPFPFFVKDDEENPKVSWYGEFELTLQGDIRLRAVQPKRSR